MPKVLNKKTDVVVGSVYIGRPSMWGNPFVIGKDGNRQEVIHKFTEYVNARPTLLATAKEKLKGKDLACFCAPLACHGDVWLKIANSD